MTPEILHIRRLVIAEAERFPDLGREYYERSGVRTQAVLAESFATHVRVFLTAYAPDTGGKCSGQLPYWCRLTVGGSSQHVPYAEPPAGHRPGGSR